MEWVNKAKLSSFLTQNLFQIRACVIRPSSFFSSFTVVRLTQIYGIFKKKKSNGVVIIFSLEINDNIPLGDKT